MSRKNIFTIHQDYEKKPDRNTFDLSFANNLTLKFGQLTPVFCKECVPGDSFRIKPSCALQFMPMAFPVQTPMRAYLHFFKTRNRTMWKDWMDFISGTKTNLVHPYVHPTDKKKFYRVGGLADYLGVPNVVYTGGSSGDGESGGVGSTLDFVMRAIDGANVNFADINGNVINYQPFVSGQNILNTSAAHWLSSEEYYSLSGQSTINSYGATYASGVDQSLRGSTLSNYIVNLPRISNAQAFQDDLSSLLGYENPTSVSYRNRRILPPYIAAELNVISLPDNYYGTFEYQTSYDVPNSYRCATNFLMYVDSDGKVQRFINLNGTIDTDGKFTSDPISLLPDDLTNIQFIYLVKFPDLRSLLNSGEYNLVNEFSDSPSFKFVYNASASVTGGVIGDGNYSITPYDDQIRLNAFPFRAYECIYNAYYRNSVNDPFKPDGVTPEYNKFNTTYEGGADETQYDLYFRNWEYDFLTSAVPTPQFGNAPLVGLTSTGAATLEDGNGNRFVVQAQLDSDGEITGWTTSKENDPSGSLRMLMNMATTGISINDLRNVNAYQRFLENAIRKGLSYRDQILAHYGVSVRYDELDMPEFIGGCSTFVDMNKINQLSEGGSTPLGSFVGQATAMMSGKHDITEYCDEHGFIIGILSIVPMPVYSQLLPKHFTHTEQLDYYFPEFKHVGYQPIAQKEVSPLQTFYNGGDLNKTFGYNRAYYDLIASTDEVHGQFRTTMRDFIMNRTFENEPVLGGEFLHVDPDQLNDVFLAGDLESSDGSNIYAADSDKIIGSLYFDVQKKSPISLYGIAKLE